MNRILLFLISALLISTLGLPVRTATQNNEIRPVPFTPVGPVPQTCFQSRVEGKLRLAVRDRDEWIALLKRMFTIDSSLGPNLEREPWTEIDFSREMVIVATMGTRPSSGYCIFIDSIYERDGRLDVTVRAVENPRCGVFPVMTAPLDIVRLPKTDRPVVFHETQVDSDCASTMLRRTQKN